MGALFTRSFALLSSAWSKRAILAAAFMVLLAGTDHVQAAFCNTTVVSQGSITPTATVQTSTTAASNARRYWTFTATAGVTYNFNLCSSGAQDTYLRLYSGTAPGTAVLQAQDDDGCGTSHASLTWECTTSGAYSVLATRWQTAGNTCAQLNAAVTLSYSIVPSPCNSAVAVASCGSSVTTAMTAGLGTWSGFFNCPAGGTFALNGKEYVYTYTPPTTGLYKVNVATNTVNNYFDIFIKSSPCAAPAAGWTCMAEVETGATGTTDPVALAGGTTYYFLFKQETTTSSGSVGWSITCAPPVPSNDLCANAATLTPSPTCVNTAGTLEGSINDGGFNCSAGGQGSGDVWYKFTATSTAHTITVAPAAILDVVWELYEGTTCGALTSAICMDIPAAGGTESDIVTGFTVGQIYYLRVMDYALYTDGATTFDICIVGPPDCISAPTAPADASAACFSTGTTALSWPSGTGANGYDVYFGTSTNPSLVATNQAGTTYNAATPTAGTYYWRVVPRSTAHGTRSDCNTVWSFIRHALPSVSAGSYGPLCSTDAPIALDGGSPVGGTWSGTGVSGSTFDPSAGTQNLTYSYTDGNSCTNTAQTTVNVTTSPSATIAYTGSPYALGAGTASVTLTGTTGGTFSAAPAGIVIDPGTGAVDLATSNPGSYTVTYEVISGPCAFTTQAGIQLNGTAVIYYSQSSGTVADPIWATVPVGTPGAAVFGPNASMVVQSGHTVTSTASVDVNDVTVQSGATLVLNNTTVFSVNGDADFVGTLTANNADLALVAPSGSILTSASPLNLFNLTVNTPNGALTDAKVRIRGTLQLTDGEFATTDTVTLVSSAATTGRLGVVGVTASFDGRMTVQRYIPAGATNWRLLGSPVGTRTILHWKDDFFTAGFPGSHYPNFYDTPDGTWQPGANFWPSIRLYDETNIDPAINDGLIGVEGLLTPLTRGQGFACWAGNTSGGTAAFTIDVTGAPHIANTPIALFMDWTNTGVPTTDGWNLVSNPVPSAIDFGSISRGADVQNAYWLFDPASGNNRAWSNGVGQGEADGIIHSSQGFWLKATGPSVTTTVSESAKVDELSGGAFGGDEEMALPIVRLKISSAINTYHDESTLVFANGTPATDAIDALKMVYAHPSAPQITTRSAAGDDMAVDFYGAYGTDITIPVTVNAAVTGTYTITANMAGIEGLTCFTLEDLATGAITPLTDGASYSFTLAADASHTVARFLLHATAPMTFSAMDGTCGDASGSATVEVGALPTDVIWTTATGTVLLSQTTVSGAVSYEGIAAGNYTVRVGSATACGELLHDFTISTEGEAPEASFTAPGMALTGEVVLFDNTSTTGAEYAWTFGDGATSTEASPTHAYLLPGEYDVTLAVTLDGCTTTTTSTVAVTISTGVEAIDAAGLRVWGAAEGFVVDHGYSGTGLVTIEVLDATGRVQQVKRVAAVPARVVLPSEGLTTGIWFVQVSYGDEQNTFRVPLVR